MIRTEIPGHGILEIEHVVLDYNGTLAVDGELLHGVAERLTVLAELVTVHVLTADTFGLAGQGLRGMPVRLTILGAEAQDEAKARFVQDLGAQRTAAIGNGRNDALMLESAALGIALILGEGASVATLWNADVVCTDVRDALELLTNDTRLIATLRR